MGPGAEPVTAACLGLHDEGPCEVLHLTDDGRHLLSAGGDGRLAGVDAVAASPLSMWSWRTRLVRMGEGALTAAAVSADRAWLATGKESETGFGAWVNPLDAETGQPMGIPKLAARFTLPVRQLCWHPSLPLLGVAADDGKLSVWDQSPEAGDAARPRRRDFPTGSGGGVRCLAFDPRSELLAAAFSSGALAIFDLAAGTELCRFGAWSKAVIGSERLAIAWRPDGGALALPGEPVVRVVLREDLLTSIRAGTNTKGQSGPGPALPATVVLLEGGHRHSTTAAAWAPAGELLATTSCEAVALWAPNAAGAGRGAEPACLLRVWRPDAQPESLRWGGNAFLVVGTAAGSWVRLTAPSVAEVQAAMAPPTAVGAEAGSPAAAPTAEAEPAVPADLSQVSTSTGVADGAGPEVVATQREPIVQRSFQPGATGAAPSSRARRRYLAWNEHGTLRFFPGTKKATAGPGQVAVEYSRERGRSAVREVRAPPGLTMGTLGPGLFVLATDAVGDRPARVTVHLATPWVRSSFDHALPHGEQVEALAAGRRFVAVATGPNRQLHIQSLAGLSLGVLALAGPVVCLAACEDLLLCVMQAPGRAPPEPELEYALYGVSAKERLVTGTLPLSPGSTLRWVGFSAEAMPLALDTAGTLRCLALSGAGPPLLAPAAGEWLPIAELEGRGRRLWPVRSEGGALSCLEVAKDGDEPVFTSVPRLRDVRYRLPLGAAAEGPESVLRHWLLAAHLGFAREAELLPPQVRRAARGGQSWEPSSDGRQALRLFEMFAKTNEVEQALDVACNYFRPPQGKGQQEVRLLAEAQRAATSAGREVLAAKTAELLALLGPATRARQGDAPENAAALGDAGDAMAEVEEAVEEQEEDEEGEQESEVRGLPRSEGDEEVSLFAAVPSLPSPARGLRRPLAEGPGVALEEQPSQRLRV